MSAITAKASRKMKKYAVLTREPRCFLGSFDFSWEQRKLSELTSMHARIGWQNLRTSEFLDSGNYMLITGTDFNDGAINFSTCHYVERERYEQDRNIQIHNGSILITKDGTLGKVAYVQGLSMPATLNAGVFNVQIKDANNVDEKYLFQYLKAPFLMDYVDKKATGGTIKHLNQSILVDFPVILPQRSEQTLIGAFFQQLDNLITLHQRKCALLFSPFQAFISMMFTTSTFSWEQRKLGDVVQITMGQSPDGSTYSDEPSDYILVQGNADLQNGWVCPRIWTTQITKKADAGDLIMSVRAPAGAMGKTAYNAVIGRGVAAIKGNEFIYQLLVKMDTDGFWKTLSCGSTFESLNSDNIKNAEVKIPTTAEQKKIGGLFQYLDNLITLHQRKCIFFTGRAGRLISTVNKKRITSSWEQRKLSEMCGTFEYGLNAAAKEFDGKNKYIRITDIDDASREFLLSDLSSPDICLDGMSKYLLSSGDIVFARTGASVGKTYIYRENDGIVYFAGFLIRAKVNQDNDAEFVFQSTLSPSYEKYIRITSQRSGQPGVNAQEYGEYDLFAPSKEEQQRIGHFLRGIANLITLHQRKPFLMKWRTSDANRNQTNRLVL